MPARGAPPKDPRQRARVNADPIPVTYAPNRAIPQPSLEELYGVDNPMTSKPWSIHTQLLWESLEDFPTCQNLQRAQWLLLGRAMCLDDYAMTTGETKTVTEARLQLSKFGVAPDDVAKLRIFFADADEKDAKRQEREARTNRVAPETQSRKRYGGLRAVDAG